MNLLPPTPLDRYRGKKYYRFQVRVTQSGLNRTLWEKRADVPVISNSATKAVNLVRDELAPFLDYPAEFECMGPGGGVAHRFVGYESLVWAKMCRVNPDETQLVLL